MELFELLAYTGVIITLGGRFSFPWKSLLAIKWMYLVGALILFFSSYLAGNPIFTGLEIIIVTASVSAFIPEKYLPAQRRAVLCVLAGIVAFGFSFWMIQQGAAWHWWDWLGVAGIICVIPGFSFVGSSPKTSEMWFIASSTLLVLNAGLGFQLGFSHLGLNYFVMNVIFGIKSVQTYFSLR